MMNKKTLTGTLILILTLIAGCGTVANKVNFEDQTQSLSSTLPTNAGQRYGWNAPENVSNINTSANSEVNPVFDPMNSTILYFARSTKAAPGSWYAFRIFSYDRTTGQVSPVTAINNWAAAVNSDNSVKPIGFSQDGSTMYLRSLTPHYSGQTGVEGIYASSRSGNSWGQPTRLASLENTNNMKNLAIMFTFSSYKMFLVKTGDTSEKFGEVYMSQKAQDWSTPIRDISNEMSAINSQAKHIYSFVIDPLSQGKSGYMSCDPSSLGANCVGKQDVYALTFDDVKQYWVRGENGAMINGNSSAMNSQVDDIVFSISADGLYMAQFSNRGNPTQYEYDIYLAKRDLVENIN